jgi:hypothetical protein
MAPQVPSLSCLRPPGVDLSNADPGIDKEMGRSNDIRAGIMDDLTRDLEQP